MSNLPDWFTPSVDAMADEKVPLSVPQEAPPGSVVKVFGWHQVHVTCPSGFVAGVYYDDKGVIKVVVKKDGPNYPWPDDITPIEETIQKLVNPKNTFVMNLMAEKRK